jgi:hypothetical protein
MLLFDGSPKVAFVAFLLRGVMALFGHIDADQQLLPRSPNLMLHLTKDVEPGIIVLYHRDLLVQG